MATAHQPSDHHSRISADEWARIMCVPADTLDAVERTDAAVRQSKELLEASRLAMDAKPCPACGREAAILFYSAHPGAARERSLVCLSCCPKTPDNT
jgi:hypothetical protein